MMEELKLLKDIGARIKEHLITSGQWKIIDKNTESILLEGSIKDLIDPDEIVIEGKIMRE